MRKIVSVSYNLALLNFFIADVQDGLGPYLGVFLKQKGFSEFSIGAINSITKLSALILAIPFGILVDRTRYKKILIALCATLISTATLLNYFYHSFYFTLLSQLVIALCGTLLAPALASITLGIMGHSGYGVQVAKNEAFKHAGTSFCAALSFVCAMHYGIVSVFIITALMGTLTLISLYCLRNAKINHLVARGGNQECKIPLKDMFKNKHILLLAITLFFFHLSNAHMLPLLSHRAYELGVDTSGWYASLTILVAQSTMILIAANLTRFSIDENLAFKLMSLALSGLIIRGLIAANTNGIVGMIIVQIIDGICAGTIGVIVPILVAKILKGSGHINAGLAFVIMSGGIGGAFSGLLGGYIANSFGYFHAYITLGAMALCGLVIWILGAIRESTRQN